MPRSPLTYRSRALHAALRLATGLAVLPLAVAGRSAAAQTPAAASGRITGRIIDAQTGAGLSDVGVQVVGTTIGTMSGVNGRFTLNGVPAGTVTVQARRIGYQAKAVSGIELRANGAVEQDITLATATVQLQAVNVTASTERGSVSAALDQQRNATGVVSAVSAQQIARSPDSDAAAAVQRVSGVTVQDGRYVFVRGLGERYTTASLNGARIPSPEPERKVVPLDLFPAGLLQSITTHKTFTPDLQGDFSGAVVDIQTREFPATRQIIFSTSIGANTAAAGRDLPGPRRAGLEPLGLASRNRGLPAVVARAGAFETSPGQGDVNGMVNAFRNSWSRAAAPARRTARSARRSAATIPSSAAASGTSSPAPSPARRKCSRTTAADRRSRAASRGSSSRWIGTTGPSVARPCSGAASRTSARCSAPARG
ncbi:MAG: carboxypeptidase regulatory-like domain-containing protein [Gemmatirosa sp.]